MSKNLLLVLFGLSINCAILAQQHSTSYFQLDSIPAIPGYVLLDSAWKFLPGDDIAWSSPSFSDSNWSPIDPIKNIYHLPELRKAGLGWLRLTLHVGEAMQGKTMTFAAFQIGASEIYLNGERIATFGTVSADPQKELTYDPVYWPIPIHLLNEPVQVIAVRYSFNKENLYPKKYSYTFKSYITTTKRTYHYILTKTGETAIYSIACGVFLIMSILHFFIYLEYRHQKVNLYLSLFTLFQLINFAPVSFAFFIHSSLASYLASMCYEIAWSLSWAFYLFTAYELFHQKKGLWFKTVIIICLLVLLVLTFTTWENPLFHYLCLIAVSLDILRINVIALRKKNSGAKIFLAGQVIFILFLCINILNTVFGFFGIGEIFDFLLLFAPFFLLLTPPVCISLIIASEIAQTNRSLKQQIDEVTRLSQKTLTQEQENRRLLATENERLEDQVTRRTAELKQSFEDLKSTQKQLIQSEKMASLGELTAGIAHEIQNPLNFVNNFSEVNMELIEEMEQEINKENIGEIKILANDIRENEEKINHHGKRAEAIVKSMLQHTRLSIGQREPTDINAMADEYLRLSYHGLRAKDKSFNATMKTDFDKTIGKITIAPQDIGRVFLNLYTNAFYAVAEKKKQQGEGYEPTVSVATQKVGEKIVVRITDNGMGISKQVLDKIYQPFFTTKPTGQGTGLGLSLSYDIIKAHEGEIKVETEEGQGSVFIVQLPA